MTTKQNWLPLEEVEHQVCGVAANQLGMPVDEVRPESRLVQDLHCDSLDAIELLMEIEDHFSVTIPNDHKSPVGKAIFARTPFRIRDLAEFTFINQGSGAPVRQGWRKKIVTPIPNSSQSFSQLGGRWIEREPANDIWETLESNNDHSLLRRRSDGMVCIKIPAAETQIGSDQADSEMDERPAHRVELSSFLIDIEPVSVVAFCRFLNSVMPSDEEINDLIGLNPADKRIVHRQFRRADHEWVPNSGAEKQPIVMVSWFAANAYSRWANDSDWRKYRSAGIHLPSEAQWEHAAEGAFASGNIQAAEHQPGTQYESTLPIAYVGHPIGISKFGLRHMSGTIWHWCRDWYDPNFYAQPASRELNAVNSVATKIRSERGGSWVGPPELCRTSYRRGRAPSARGRCLGFRCVFPAVEHG